MGFQVPSTPTLCHSVPAAGLCAPGGSRGVPGSGRRHVTAVSDIAGRVGCGVWVTWSAALWAGDGGVAKRVTFRAVACEAGRVTSVPLPPGRWGGGGAAGRLSGPAPRSPHRYRGTPTRPAPHPRQGGRASLTGAAGGSGEGGGLHPTPPAGSAGPQLLLQPPKRGGREVPPPGGPRPVGGAGHRGARGGGSCQTPPPGEGGWLRSAGGGLMAAGTGPAGSVQRGRRLWSESCGTLCDGGGCCVLFG